MQANNSSSKHAERTARTFSESARRTQIVDVAIRVVATAGFGNASFARIAKEAGLSSTGIISYNFDGKDDLMREVIAQVLRVADAYIQPRIDKAAGARAKLRAYIEAQTSFLMDFPNHLRALVEVFGNLPRDGADRALFLAQMDAVLS